MNDICKQLELILVLIH